MDEMLRGYIISGLVFLGLIVWMVFMAWSSQRIAADTPDDLDAIEEQENGYPEIEHPRERIEREQIERERIERELIEQERTDNGHDQRPD